MMADREMTIGTIDHNLSEDFCHEFLSTIRQPYTFPWILRPAGNSDWRDGRVEMRKENKDRADRLEEKGGGGEEKSGWDGIWFRQRAGSAFNVLPRQRYTPTSFPIAIYC